MSKQIKELCQVRQIDFESGIVTNGYLLDERHIQDLIALQCNSIQVTLDGPKFVHDQRRCLISGESTFDVIIGNMRKALDMNCVTAIELRINCDMANRDYIDELLGDLQTKFSPEELDISIGIISGTVKHDECSNVTNIIPVEQLSATFCELLDSVQKHGFSIPQFYSFDGLCIAKSRYSFVLSPDGKIYRCLSMIGREDLSVGTIQNMDPSMDLPSCFNTDMYKSCIEKECEFLPLCHTGCKFDAYVEYNSFDKNACKYDQYCDINRYLMCRIEEREESE